jgi:hypothetical protein
MSAFNLKPIPNQGQIWRGPCPFTGRAVIVTIFNALGDQIQVVCSDGQPFTVMATIMLNSGDWCFVRVLDPNKLAGHIG